MDLQKLLESVLFFKSEPVTVEWLSETLKKNPSEITNALEKLGETLKDRGIRLITTDKTVALGSAPEAGDMLEQIAKLDLERNLGKASLETLTIILYRGPITKSEIDYIRGVNSNFILRALLVRGLIEREKKPKDERSFLYKPTIDLLRYIHLEKISDLPEYEKLREEIITFEHQFGDQEKKEIHEAGE